MLFCFLLFFFSLNASDYFKIKTKSTDLKVGGERGTIWPPVSPPRSAIDITVFKTKTKQSGLILGKEVSLWYGLLLIY